MNHTINLKDPNSVVKPIPIKPNQKFLYQFYIKLGQEQASGRVYKHSDTSACAMFMIPKIVKPNEARFLHNLVASDSNTIMEPPNIPDQSTIINTIARYPCRSNVDLSDMYHNIRIHAPHKKHTACVTPYRTYRTRVMQPGDCNATATFQTIMNNLFRDELGICVYVYIDDIFIFSKTYKDH